MGKIKRSEVALVAVDEQSRLSRSIGAAALIQDLTFANVRFISVSEKIDTCDQWMGSTGADYGHASQHIRPRHRPPSLSPTGRTRSDGNGSAGDSCFGYKSKYLDLNWAQILESGKKPKKEMIVDEAESITVSRMFNLFVQGHSINSIAAN